MRNILSRISASAAAAALVASLVPAVASADGTSYTYTQNTDVQIGSRTLRIMAGSQRDTLTVGATNLTVTVGAGQAFIIRDPEGSPHSIENDALQPGCNVLPDRTNQLTLNGPVTATLTPGEVFCSTGSAATNATPVMTFLQPNGGQSYKAGDTVQVLWQNANRTPASVKVSLSADGGQTWSVVADNLINIGFYSWTVPLITTTAHARLRVDGVDQGRIVAFDLSDADFSIEGTAPPVAPPAAAPYDPALATAHADSIDANQGFSAQNAVQSPCVAGMRIKGKSSTAVYYCGADGKRHAFPNQRIHDSWFTGFAGVGTVTDETLAQIPLGANVKYRPGVRMIKIQSDPKVYAVDANGSLRWVQEEASALALYGADWNKKIDDVSDAFFTDYSVGDPVPLH
jgi:hypothetical protein